MGSGFGKSVEPQPTVINVPPDVITPHPRNNSPKMTMVQAPVDNEQIPIQEVDCPLGGVEKKALSPLEMDKFMSEAATSKYCRKRSIGKGVFGDAYIVVRTSDQAQFVAKSMALNVMSQKDKKYTQNEILCLATAKHFAIIQYEEHLAVDDDCVIIIMEYANGGDLHTSLKKHKTVFSEREAGILFVQLLLALDHIHKRRMIHRDVKSANVFLTNGGLLKLGDFGFSQWYDQTVSNPIATTFLGTPFYLAPEMWHGNRYGKKADIWAAGIVLFELLTSRKPFNAQTMPQLREMVLDGKIDIPSEISREMHDFISLMFAQDPNKRPSAGELLETEVMQHYITLLQRHVANSSVLSSDVKKTILATIDENVTPKDALQVAVDRVLVPKETARGSAVIFEGPVLKETDGSWKQRYLIIEDGFLTMTLGKGREAAVGSEQRSKKISTQLILSVVSCPPIGSQQFVFAISTSNSAAITMATSTMVERDNWIQHLLFALDMG